MNKKYVIYAGVNGCGKTTLYNTNKIYSQIPRINIDEIVKNFGSWKSKTDIINAGKIATRTLKEYLDNGISFNQETTLCGHTILKIINKAKEKGYFIEMHYIGVKNVTIAKERIKSRVEKGGHDIPNEIIEKRYFESLNHAKIILPLCNLAEFYDNTLTFKKIALFESKNLIWKATNIPERFNIFL